MADDAKLRPQREISKFKTNVRKLEKEKDKLLPDLGKAAYQAFLDGRLQEASLADTFEKLKALDAQIEQGQAEIARLTAQVEQIKAAARMPKDVRRPTAAACPYCGAAVAPGVKFCGNCGKEAAPPAPPAAAVCANCGGPLAQGMKFCAQCGTHVDTATTPPPMTTVSPAAPSPAPPPPPPPAAAPAPAITGTPGAVIASVPGKCPSCGAAVEEADAEFCGECGARLS